MKKSIELCDIDGMDALGVLAKRRSLIGDTEIYAGGRIVDFVFKITQVADILDGYVEVEAQIDNDTTVFQFLPFLAPFKDTARDIDGLPMCKDC